MRSGGDSKHLAATLRAVHQVPVRSVPTASSLTAICARCGNFTPGAQAGASAETFLCPPCMALVLHLRPSLGAVLSAVLGTVGPCLGFAPGLLGLLLGELELRRIRKNPALRAGEPWARAGRVLGWLNVALGLVVLLTLRW